jgi:hypothetical protein
VIQRTTAQNRVRRAMNAGWQWCRHHRHDPRREPDRRLSQTLQGHDQDDGIRGHDRKRAGLYPMAEPAWRYGLRRRRQQSAIRGEKCCKRLKGYPRPTPRIVQGLAHGLQGRPVLRESLAEARATEEPDA